MGLVHSKIGAASTGRRPTDTQEADVAKAAKDILIDRGDGHAKGAAKRLVARAGQDVPEKWLKHPQVQAQLAPEPSDAGSLAAPEDEGAYDGMTVPQLKAELEARSIEYEAGARKADLIEALEDHDADNGD